MKNKLLENIVALSTIKGLEYILAFITFPYLVRVLGVEYYGILVFAQGILQYFLLFTDYGFVLTGPRAIASHNEKRERGIIFARIFFAKLFLLGLSTVVFVFGLSLVRLCYGVDYALYVILYLNVVGNVLFPIWFFQGIQQMRYITLANVLARLCSLLGLLMMVKNQGDYLWAAFYQSVVPIIAACVAWCILLKDYREVLVIPAYAQVRQTISYAWGIFVSTVAINLYTASSVVFLGIFANNTVVGYFSGAKKIIDNIMQLMMPVMQAVYPYVCGKTVNSKQNAISFLRKLIIILGGSNFALSLLLFVFADRIVFFLLGDGYGDSIDLLRIMAFLPFVISLSNIFGIQTMLNFGMQRIFSRILIGGAVFNIILVLPLTYWWLAHGTSLSIMVTEIVITLVMYAVLRKHGVF